MANISKGNIWRIKRRRMGLYDSSLPNGIGINIQAPKPSQIIQIISTTKLNNPPFQRHPISIFFINKNLLKRWNKSPMDKLSINIRFIEINVTRFSYFKTRNRYAFKLHLNILNERTITTQLPIADFCFQSIRKVSAVRII